MENIKFEQLGICPEIQKAVKYMGFEEASPIQAKAIPVILEGKDIIGQAQTELCFVQRENWQFRWQKKSEIWQNICTV